MSYWDNFVRSFDDILPATARQVDNFDTILADLSNQLADISIDASRRTDLTSQIRNINDYKSIGSINNLFKKGDYDEGFSTLRKLSPDNQTKYLEKLKTLEDKFLTELFPGANIENIRTATSIDELENFVDTGTNKLIRNMENALTNKNTDDLQREWANMKPGQRVKFFKSSDLSPDQISFMRENARTILVSSPDPAFNRRLQDLFENRLGDLNVADELGKKSRTMDSWFSENGNPMRLFLDTFVGKDKSFYDFLVRYGAAAAVVTGGIYGVRWAEDYRDNDNKQRKCIEQCLPREWGLYQAGVIKAEDLENPAGSEEDLFPPSRTCFKEQNTCFNNDTLNTETKGRPDVYCTSADMNCNSYCKQSCKGKYVSNLGLFFDAGVEAVDETTDAMAIAIENLLEGLGKGVGGGAGNLFEELFGDSWMWYVGGVGAIILLVVIIMLFRK